MSEVIKVYAFLFGSTGNIQVSTVSISVGFSIHYVISVQNLKNLWAKHKAESSSAELGPCPYTEKRSPNKTSL